MHIFPTISTTFIVISAIFVAFGWYHIVKGNEALHKKLMITGAVFALLFFIVYMSRTIFEGNTEFNGPEGMKLFYQIFLTFHIILATVSAVFGITTLVLAFKEKFAKHKKIGRITATLWMFTAPTGVLVYILLYILYPGGMSKPMLDVIFGW